MLIVYNEPRSHTIGDLFTLLPGVNEIDPLLWAKCKEIKLIQFYIKAGSIVEKSVDSIRNMAPDAAIEMIKATPAIDLLDRWREGETRKKVIEALSVQRALVVEQLKAAESENDK